MIIGLLVSVVDDDRSVRESLPDLLKQFGYAVQTFRSAEEFLVSTVLAETGVLVLDIVLPGMSGPDLQRELQHRGYNIPIIFITALEDGTLRHHLISRGAVECLSKPFVEADLIKALDKAVSAGNSTPKAPP